MNGKTTAALEPINRAAYARRAKVKLAEARDKMRIVNGKLTAAITQGEMTPTVKLNNARDQVDSYLERIEHDVGHLQEARGEAWTEAKNQVETGWDDLAEAIKKLVTRISEGAEK